MNKVYGYDNNIYETSIGNIKHINDEEYLSNIVKDFKGNLVEYIEQLKQKAELGEHYKYLYSEVKKQKDDVVEYIKNNAEEYKWEDDDGAINKDYCCEGTVILRMLGEIDD